MGTKILKVLGVALGASAVFAFHQAQATFDNLKAGDKAPAFSSSGTDGKTHTLASLTKEGPVFLYFIKEGCPVNHQAAPFITKMNAQYGGKANIVGVYNGSVEEAKSWQKRYGAKYLLISDPDLRVIRGYGVPYSPFLISVNKDGKVGKIFEGLSAKELSTVNGMVAKSLEKDVVAMSFQGAPSGGG